MLAKKAAGRNASALKYDVLTAMGAYALSANKGQQKTVLRLMTLITARYNWQRDVLAVGQKEIARLWNVDERTVKREMAKLRALGWLVVKRQGARGRVGEYGLGLQAVLDSTQPYWHSVGPDFEHRMKGEPEPAENVIPLKTTVKVAAPDLSDGSEWSLAKGLLHAEDAGIYSAWVAALQRSDRAGGHLTLTAPSRFHASYVLSHLKPRLLAACQSVDPSVDEIFVTA